MVSINLDDLDEETAVRLRARAAGNGCSMEEEALNILRIALDKPGMLPYPKNHAAAIHELFKDLNFGVEVRLRSENPDPVVRYYWLDDDDDNS